MNPQISDAVKSHYARILAHASDKAILKELCDHNAECIEHIHRSLFTDHSELLRELLKLEVAL